MYVMRILASVIVAVMSVSGAAGLALGQVDPAPTSDRLSEVLADGTLTDVATGFKFTEGPLWDGTTLMFCDLAGNIVYRVPAGAALPITPDKAEKLIDPSGSAAGLCFDGEGKLVVAQFDGKVRRSKSPRPGAGAAYEVIAENVNGNAINKANDLVIAKNGSTYFTEFGGGNVLRLSPEGDVTLVAREIKSPNGVTLSPDEKKLYIAEYGSKKIWVCDVKPDGSLSEKTLFAETTGSGRGSPDGIKTDEKGNVYSTGPGGIFVFAPSGEKLGVINAPGASNFCFGGPDGKTLYITAGGSVKSCRMNVAGARVQQAK